ncbi:tyrosine-type recombinase/integrase [Paenibacillus sp. M1]|uniref:Tyrosine-type recombinase/integrase n=1 Tax=Paenibacillus haidiansis TaxID=1574488 RepID=A0ABU7VZW1_9BACL
MAKHHIGLISVVMNMGNLKIEKTLNEAGKRNVVVVDEDYNIVEEITLFLHYLEEKGHSENTIEGYSRDLKEYFTWLNEVGLKFYEVRKADMFSWLEYLKTKVGTTDKEKSAKTKNKYMATIASFYRYYEVIGGFVTENPLTYKDDSKNRHFLVQKVSRKDMGFNFFRVKEKKSVKGKRLTREQVEKLYQGLEMLQSDESLNARNQLLFRFLYETGCRISEALGLRIGDYEIQTKVGVIKVKEHDPLYHKDHNIKSLEREIPVSRDIVFAIEDYILYHRPDDGKHLTIFVNHETSPGQYMIRDTITKLFNKLSEQVGIKCTSHMLRHTHGTELTESGFDMRYVQDRLGHNDVKSTSKYQHLSLEAKTTAYESFMRQRRSAELN